MADTRVRRNRRPPLSSLRLRYQLGLAFAAFSMLAVGAVTAATYARFSAQLLDATRAKLTALVTLAALDIDGAEHAKLTRAEDEGSPGYLALQQRLRDIRDSIGVRFVYTVRATKDGTIAFVVDAEENPEDVSHLGDLYEDAPPSLQENITSGAGPFAEKSFYTDEWGTFLSGFAPIRTPGGAIDAYVGLDLPLADFLAARRSFLVTAILIGVALLVPLVALGLLLGASLSRPLMRVSDVLKSVAEGHLNAEPQEQDTLRGDEIGELSRSAGKLTLSMRRVFGELNSGIATLASSSVGLLAVSDESASGARESTSRSSAVAAAAEQMSVNTTSVAAGMEEASARLASVAAATEELASTITGIAASTERTRATAEDAGRRAESFAGLVKGLTGAAQEIGKVTETIGAISAQTNLLALNATIEAARAGLAGKGFAVVAGEVKALARQSATATVDIRSRIEGIQSAAAAALSDTQSLVGLIRDVSEIVTNNAAAIEEQSVVTRDLASNVAQASLGVSDASRRAGEMAGGTRDIAADIATVSATAGRFMTASSTLHESARELSGLAEAMRRLLSQFAE